MSSIAAEISGICAKDLMRSEARYRSFNNAFVRIVVMQPPRAGPKLPETIKGQRRFTDAVYFFLRSMNRWIGGSVDRKMGGSLDR